MSIKYNNDNSKGQISEYKYLCETKILNSVKQGITCNPAILFLVDIATKEVFFIHISPEFVISLSLANEKKKTIYFNETDRLKQNTFFEIFSHIYSNFKKRIYSEIGSTLTASDGLDKTTVTVLQEIIDNFNAVFDNELVFIKKSLFPNVWKFGIAFVKHDNDFASIGIYKIHRGENGILIRKFGQESFNDCTAITCYKSSYKSTGDIIRDQMFKLIDSYFDKAFIGPMFLPNVVLEEIAFNFLDAISSSCDSYSRKDQPYVYFKDVVTIEEIEHLWNTLVDYSLETSSYLRMVSKTPEIRVIKIDPLESLRSGYEFEKQRALFDQIYKTSIERRHCGFTLEFEGRFAYNLVHDTIQELRRRKLDFISRVWAPKNYQKSFEELNSMSLTGANRFETGYLLEDFQSNLQKLIRLLPSEYCNTSTKLFGRYHQDFNCEKICLSVLGEHTPLSVCTLNCLQLNLKYHNRTILVR